MVAVKIVRKRKLTEEQLERTIIELETLKLCQHPNIIRLFDIFENSEILYIVTEFLSGGNLLSYLQRHAFNLSEIRACQIIHSVSHSIHYLHTYGIVHRDIKPENIVLVDDTENSEVKLVDFGLAKILAPLEKTQEQVGTLCYTAPEIIKGEKYEKNVDMWSLGVLSYLLVVGQLPFSDPISEANVIK